MDTVDAGPPASLNVQETVLTMRECRPNMVQSPVREAGRGRVCKCANWPREVDGTEGRLVLAYNSLHINCFGLFVL